MVWLNVFRLAIWAGAGTVRPCTTSALARETTSRASQSGCGTQSSSVNAISGARAARQPTLRAAPGPTFSSRCTTVRENGTRSRTRSSVSVVVSVDASLTTTTSNDSVHSCSPSAATRRANGSDRLRVATTTAAAGPVTERLCAAPPSWGGLGRAVVADRRRRRRGQAARLDPRHLHVGAEVGDAVHTVAAGDVDLHR